MAKEGPTIINSTRLTCGLCKFHRQHMLKSGEHPEYRHFCGHPASIGHEQRAMGWLPSWFFPTEDGREIGDTDNTPEWCPVAAAKN